MEWAQNGRTAVLGGRNEGNGADMKRWFIIALAAFLAGGVTMAKEDLNARNTKGVKADGATSSLPVGNLSKARRDHLIAEIAEIKAFLERSAGADTNATRLLGFATELEKEVRGKKFGLVFEEHRERVDVELMENIPVLTENQSRFVSAAKKAGDAPLNFLIEGDNLPALKLLEKTHRGRIDFIYIDPPYNTGKKDSQGFIYNDSYVDKNDTFRHSKWLSFMKKRLEIARRLMSNKGVIFISIDDNEQAALKLLCDEVFGPENFIANMIWQQGKKSSGNLICVNHEYVIVYAKKRDKIDKPELAWKQKKVGLTKSTRSIINSENDLEKMIRQ